jgi:hypothetical protein
VYVLIYLFSLYEVELYVLNIFISCVMSLLEGMVVVQGLDNSRALDTG